MPTIHLVIGPVGAGKSTFVRSLTDRGHAIPLVLDDWMTTLYGDDERPADGRMAWYMARTQRCLDQIWKTTEAVLATGVDVVLEVGLIQRAARQSFYGRVDAGACELVVHVVDADRDRRRKRVMRRNESRGPTYSMHVSAEIFELASDLWQPPGADEQADRDVRFVL